MTDEAALLAAIYANPDEDTPRLVYADWLDENGDPDRAEFIRVQIELSHLTDEDEREPPLHARQRELERAYCERWTAELGIVESDDVKVEFRRGFIDELSIFKDIPSGIDLVCSVPGVRRVSLWRQSLTPEIIQRLAALDLDSLTIRETPFPTEWLELLMPLPCGTVLSITSDDEPFPADVWHAFQTGRLERLASLSPSQRHSEALRWQRGHAERHPYSHSPGREGVILHEVKACDVELQFLTELKHLEEVHLSYTDVTLGGVAIVATLPNLKWLELWRGRFEAITPLAACTTLEKLRVWPDHRVVIPDSGTEGLERLVNLRELFLRDDFGELTLARLGSLRNLTSLDIELSRVEDAECFASFSQLTALEHLEIGGHDGEVPGGALRFLAPCRKLQTMKLGVRNGTADDFAALGLLTELREVHITGDAVTDEAIRHFTPLKKLRTLLVRKTEITPEGARWLADQLPEVTIILDEHVAKSQRSTVTFCRRLAEGDDFVSALLPTHWNYNWGGTTAEPNRALVEDGWSDNHGYSSGVAPAFLYLYGWWEESNPAAVLEQITRCNDPKPENRWVIEERDVVELAGEGVSCVCSLRDERSLFAVLESEGKCAVVDCYVPASRFDEFRPLFEYVARSLRVGSAASQGVGEVIEVPLPM